jgi:hypothetical protein
MTAQHILKDIELDELSGVDHPAQEHATAVVTKRQSIVKVGGETAITTDPVTKDDKTMTDAEQKALNDKLDAATNALAKANEALAKAQSERDVALKFAELSDEHRSFAKRLTGDERATFVVKSAGDRQKHIEEVRGPEVYVWKGGNKTFYASDDQDKVIMAKRDDIRAQEADELKKSRDEAIIAKRVKEEIPNLDGTDVAKAALLRAIDTIADAEVKKSVTELLTKSDSQCEILYKRAGASPRPGDNEGNGSGTAADQIDNLAKRIEKEKGVSFEKAYELALDSREGQQLYASMFNRSAATR